MKALKYIIYALLVLLVLFLAIGILKPTVNYGHEVTVDKPIKEAWAVHQDDSKLGEWLDGFKSIELKSGEKGKTGSTYNVVVQPSESEPEFKMVETIVDVEEFDHITLNFDSEMMVFDQTTTFTENDGGTTIKTDSKVKGKGIMMRSMFGLMDMLTGSFQKQEVKHLEALKQLIEENTTDYYPPVEVMEEAEVAPEEGAMK